MDLWEVRDLCVAPFAGNHRRTHLFRLLEEFVADFGRAGIPCDIWLDGSFLTVNPDPKDLDITVMVNAYATLSPQQDALVDRAASGYADDVDSFAYYCLRREDPGFYDEDLNPAHTWGQTYGWEHGKIYAKGFVVIALGERHV